MKWRTWLWISVILIVSEECGVGFTRIKNRSFTLLRMTNRFVVLDEGPGFDCHSERQEESGVGFTRIKNRSFTLLRITNRFVVLKE